MANLAYGSSGSDVKELQKALIAAGYDVGSSGADGIIGKKTRAAIQAYQRDNGLAVDGIAGANTQGSLRNRGYYDTQQPGTVVYQTAGSGGGNTADLSQYLKDSAAAKLESELANLKSAYESNLSKYEEQARNLPAQYEQARNNAAAQAALARRSFNERAVAGGLNTGTAGQYDLTRSSVYQNALAEIDRQQAQALADIEAAKTDLRVQYENAIAEAKANGDAALADNLYNELLRVQNANAGSASAVNTAVQSSAGTNSTGSPYNNGGLTGAQVALMQQAYGATPDGKWGAESAEKAGGLSAQEAWNLYVDVQKKNDSRYLDK